ncbi:MAG: tRNA(His) guanylyltransferase Thg1 family protein [Ktedonobacteraceae bacterium]
MSTIGDRIKRYEQTSNLSLLPRSPLFIRIDGKSFHTYTRGCNKPFDQNLIDAMVTSAQKTAKEMSGFVAAYIQSDECTFMLEDYDTFETQGWFNYELNKVVSVSASAFTAYFNEAYRDTNPKPALFDSRAFTVPIDDAPNVFIWRQRDWERNSIQMLARAHFSHRECEHKKVPELHEMLYTKGVNWANLDDQLKNGTFLLRELAAVHFKATYEDLVVTLERGDRIEGRR